MRVVLDTYILIRANPKGRGPARGLTKDHFRRPRPDYFRLLAARGGSGLGVSQN